MFFFLTYHKKGQKDKCVFFAYFFDGIKIYDTHFYKYYFNVPFLKAGIIIESLYVYMQSLFSSSEKFKKKCLDSC